MGSDDMGNLKRKEQILRKNPNPSKRNFEWGSWLLAGVSDTDGSTITHLSRGDGYLELWVDWDHTGYSEYTYYGPLPKLISL